MKTNPFPAPVQFLTPRQPFIIAEIGGNHEGSFDYAKKLLHDAIESGAQAVKFQIYEGDSIVSKIEGPERNKHFKKFEFPYENYFELARLAKEGNIIFMASLWDASAVKAFDPILSIHKVGSGDLTNYPLLELLAKTNKPVILSTAMATLLEIQQAVSFIDSVNPLLRRDHKLCLMHCVAMYGEPKDEYAQLGAIRVMQQAFPDIHIGYSDHTVGTYACEMALGMGAHVLEVHFTDDKTRAFRDHQLSITKEEMKNLAARSRQIVKLLGDPVKEPVPGIETSQRISEFRRAVYPVRDLEAGSILAAADLTTLRPNKGIDAREFYQVVGKRLKCSVKAYHALDYSFLE